MKLCSPVLSSDGVSQGLFHRWVSAALRGLRCFNVPLPVAKRLPSDPALNRNDAVQEMGSATASVVVRRALAPNRTVPRPNWMVRVFGGTEPATRASLAAPGTGALPNSTASFRLELAVVMAKAHSTDSLTSPGISGAQWNVSWPIAGAQGASTDHGLLCQPTSNP
jgi:hypothetical protein